MIGTAGGEGAPQVPPASHPDPRGSAVSGRLAIGGGGERALRLEYWSEYSTRGQKSVPARGLARRAQGGIR